MDEIELTKLCLKPGMEGSLWRLIREWDPDKVALWVKREKRAGLGPEEAVQCVAEVMAGACFVLAQSMTGDKRGAILGDRGLINMLKASVAHKLEQVGGAHIVSPHLLPK